MGILEEIAAYQPFNEQEERDKAVMLRLLSEKKDAFSRSSALAHMTASAWVVDASGTRVLMLYHNIYHSWSWAGGHADGDEDLLAVAIREVREETGLRHLTCLCPGIFSLENLTVDGHEKRGVYVPSHIHCNVTYLLQAAEEPLREKPDENSGVRWFTPEEALRASTEPWMVERIYRKLTEKSRRYMKMAETKAL